MWTRKNSARFEKESLRPKKNSLPCLAFPLKPCTVTNRAGEEFQPMQSDKFFFYSLEIDPLTPTLNHAGSSKIVQANAKNNAQPGSFKLENYAGLLMGQYVNVVRKLTGRKKCKFVKNAVLWRVFFHKPANPFPPTCLLLDHKNYRRHALQKTSQDVLGIVHT